jgi:hypothetical protein
MSESRDYARLGCVAFGKALVASRDLDPVYVAVHHAELPSDQRARLLVAYWCLYHLGAAARLSELKERVFWGELATAAENAHSPFLPKHAAGRWPRGTERRHWRGAQAVASCQSVLEKAKCGREYRPSAEHLVDWLGSGKTFAKVTQHVLQLRGFGPWIAFKVADMLERCAGYRVDFVDCHLGFYDEPRKGAWLYANERKHKPFPYESMSLTMVGMMTHKLLGEVGRQFAPPDMRRKLNVQEAETIFCKWKSHLHGHYALGKDTREVYHGLHGWGAVADLMRIHLAKLPYAPRKGEHR